MTQVGTNQSTTYHNQPPLSTSGGQTGRSSSTSRQQQQQQQPSQYETDQLANIRPRLCTLRKWPHYDGYGVHLARNQHWLGLRIGDVEPNSPAESGGLLREDVVLAVNGHSVENDDFFVILSFIQHELEDDQIRFLVLDPHSADLARRHHINIDENYRTCVRMETPTLTVSPEKLLYDQWRTTNNVDPTAAQNTINLGPTLSLNQTNINNQRYPQKPPNDGRDDVYTFLPYSDHAIENGKSFFDVLFDQDGHSKPSQHQSRHTIEYPHTRNLTGDDDHNDDDHDDDDNNKSKGKKRGSGVRDGVKNLVKAGLDNIKSVLPTRNNDNKEKDVDADSKRKTSSDSIKGLSKYAESPALVNKSEDKSQRSSGSSDATDQAQHPAYEPLWQTPSQRKEEDTNNSLRPEPRMCSLTLRPGVDTIGISLQPDKDFGHIIKQVEPNSLADRAGIERDDCIMSLNDTALLNIPYDDVLNVLKKSRNDPNLDFLVAKKSYLLKSYQNNAKLGNIQHDTPGKYADTTGEVMPSSNINGKNTASPSQALEQLFYKYNKEQQSQYDEQLNSNHPRETVSTTTTNDRHSPQLDNDRYASKQQGQILQGVGPATADRSSWGVSSGKSADDLPAPISGDSSIRSNSRGRRPDTDDTKGRHGALEDAFKPLQVGITNPTPTQQSGNISPNFANSSLADDGQRTSRPTSSIEQRDTSPKGLPSPNTAGIHTRGVPSSSSSSRNDQHNQNVQSSVPFTSDETSSTLRDHEQGSSQSTPSAQSDLRLGPTKAMSVPSKPIKVKSPMAVYEDTDDDDLSDISERSREEDISEPVSNKTSLQTAASADHEKDNSESALTPTVGVFTADSADKKSNLNDKRTLTSTKSDADKNPVIPSATSRSVVQARRLEHSDSEDTTSGADSHPTKHSATETFYSPDESVDDGEATDDPQSDTLRQNEINQVKTSDNIKTEQPRKSGYLYGGHDDNNEDDESGSESSSSESRKTPVQLDRMALATMPLSELKNHDYELHNIQLMQPTETSPVGLRLVKQQDPLQYIIKAVAKGTKADLAGLKVNDWLIKIEDNDIRLVEFPEVSQDIRQLLTNAGLINMVIARKRTPTSSPAAIKQTDKQQTASSSRSESMNRPQEGQTPRSLLTTDITRDTPDNNQVRFIPEPSTSPSTVRSQQSPVSSRGKNATAPGGPFSVGLTNPIPDEKTTKSPRSQSPSPSRSPARDYTINQQQKPTTLSGKTSSDIDPNDIRHITLKEALGLDFNSFIPEGDSEIQTHFISNVQPSSMADKAGLRDGDRILTVNDVDVTNAVHEDVRRMMQSKKPLQLSVVNDSKYLELIENVKRNQIKIENTRDKPNFPPPDYDTVEPQKSSDPTNRGRPPVRSGGSDSGSDSNILRPKSASPRPTDENLSKYLRPLFNDDEGQAQIKYCILKKDPTYNGYGLLLRYQNGLHLIDQVEEDSPAYNAGLREDDVILFVDKKNVEQMTHDDVKILIRKLSLSNTNIELILIKKNDIQRYRSYQEHNVIDWKPIFKDKIHNETNIIQTEQPQELSSVTRVSNDQASAPRKISSSSGKQQAPPPPTVSPLVPGTRVCTLQPSANHTAGFALSGNTSAPFTICQIEKNSPAEKAGLLLNDALISINGKSVTETSYEETVKLVKEALQQKNVELVVREQSSPPLKDNTQNQSKMGSQSSVNDQTKFSMGSNDSNNLSTNSGSIGGGEAPSRRSANAVEEYQKQRNKELSYTLRLCHLHPTNGDGTHAATFGFELSEDPAYEYPLILRVEPQSSAEGAGLQSRDILLKINDRKTKGLGYDKVKKEIEKAKRDGRLEMLVVDQETFDYCRRTKKPLKEPEMKVKHIFPKSRSSASFHKLPVAAVATAHSSRNSIEQLNHSARNSADSLPIAQPNPIGYRLSTPKESDSENEEDNQRSISEQKKSQPAVNFHLSDPIEPRSTASARTHESPLKFLDTTRTAPQQTGASSIGSQNLTTTSQPAQSGTSTKDSKVSKAKAIPNAINNLFHKIGHPKSSKPDYDAAPKATTSSKLRAPSPPTVRVGHNRLDVTRVSQSLDTVASNPTTAPISSIHDTVRSTISTGSFDYLRGPRRCVLKVDRNKGLGFVLSATGDFDHTITAVEKYSAADIAGLQVNDEVLEVDGADVRNVKYEQVVDMLVSAMRTNETIEMRVIDGHSRDVYPSPNDVDKQTNPNNFLNTNNNNNNNTVTTIHSQRTTVASGDNLSDINSSISPFDSFNQQKIATSYPNLPGQFRQFDNVTNRALSGSVPALATGITASPHSIHPTKMSSNSSEKGSITKLSDISSQDAPVARLCRIRKFPTSPFYGFFLCGDPKKLGRVFISDVTKHSPAAVCGLRDGDRILEINGSSINTSTYESILDKIKQHMAHDDLELLVLDKKSVHWYRDRNYPITSRTLPTIVHIEPIINDKNFEIQSSEVPTTHTKMVGFADRRVSKTGL